MSKTTSWERPASGLLLAVKHHDLDETNARLLIEIARDTATSDTPIRSAKGATAAGDRRRLRGIPALSRGVGGAMNNTRPGHGGIFAEHAIRRPL